MPHVIAPTERRASGVAQTRGVLFVHACPRALTPHVEWAVSAVLERAVTLTWIPQPVAPGTLRAELSWQCDPGTAARLATSLRGFSTLRYEVTAEPSGTDLGERYSVTPALGMFHAQTGPHGDILIPEDRLRTVMAAVGSGPALTHALHDLLGTAWDTELEPFRYAGDGATIRYLHRVG